MAPLPCFYYDMCNLPAVHIPPGPCIHTCILHSPDPHKDKDAFSSAFNQYRALEERKGIYRFNCIVFPDDTSLFKGAVFRHPVQFNGARFHGTADFQDACFKQDVDFTLAHFLGKANFTSTVFDHKAVFYSSVFHDSAYFDRAAFNGAAYFRHVLFEQQAYISRCTFSDSAHFLGAPSAYVDGTGLFLGPAYFMDNRFDHPERVKIESVDMRTCRLYGTRLDNMDLENIIWRIDKSGRIILHDESVMTERNLSAVVEGLYRELKISYSRRGDHETVGRLFYSEKELARRRTSFFRDPLLFIYWLSSGYGENAGRAVLGLVIIWLVFALLYYAAGMGMETARLEIVNALLHSFRVATLQRPAEPLSLALTARIAQALETVIGPVQIALITLAIRQRLRR